MRNDTGAKGGLGPEKQRDWQRSDAPFGAFDGCEDSRSALCGRLGTALGTPWQRLGTGSASVSATADYQNLVGVRGSLWMGAEPESVPVGARMPRRLSACPIG